MLLFFFVPLHAGVHLAEDVIQLVCQLRLGIENRSGQLLSLFDFRWVVVRHYGIQSSIFVLLFQFVQSILHLSEIYRELAFKMLSFGFVALRSLCLKLQFVFLRQVSITRPRIARYIVLGRYLV